MPADAGLLEIKMKTTLNKIKFYSPCQDRYKKLLTYLGKTEADDEPLDFSAILESNGLHDCIWCFRGAPEYDNEWRLFAIWCARQVAHLMLDSRNITALEVAEKFAMGNASNYELVAAKEAAWAAAVDATWAAAWDELVVTRAARATRAATMVTRAAKAAKATRAARAATMATRAAARAAAGAVGWAAARAAWTAAIDAAEAVGWAAAVDAAWDAEGAAEGAAARTTEGAAARTAAKAIQKDYLFNLFLRAKQ